LPLANSHQGRLHQRPRPNLGTPLEYTTHRRDVLRLFRRLIGMILRQDEPTLTVMSHEAKVANGGYNRLDPLLVAAQIEVAAHGLAETLRRPTASEYSRRGIREQEERSLLEIAQRALHESQPALLNTA